MRYGFWMVAAAVVVLDQATKLWAVSALSLHEPPRPVIPGLLSLELVYNLGVAFGQLQGGGILLVLAAAVACVGIVVYRARALQREGHLPPLLWLGLALPLGGAIGNMIDRIRLGHVVDFIAIGWWPRFNVADSAITVGAFLLAVYFLFLSGPETEAEPEPPVAAREAGNEQGV